MYFASVNQHELSELAVLYQLKIIKLNYDVQKSLFFPNAYRFGYKISSLIH